MELELKHLAPYLPYNLEGISSSGTIFLLSTFSNMKGRGVESRSIDMWLSNRFKPLLLPLSSLTKADWSLYMSLYGLTKTEILENHIEYLPYGLINSWFENHIDIFGLIEAGLAIDINTL